MTAAALEDMLGDPRDPANPVGYPAVLAADERREMLAEGERLLDRYRLNAEFVPVAHGGRLVGADRLAEVLRAVWRRDPGLGLGYGFGSLIAAVNIWCAGSEAHRRRAAGLLLDNKRLAAAFHEPAHGTEVAGPECTARRTGDGWLLTGPGLTGPEEIVTGLRRPEATVLFARTGPARDSRAYSQFLVAPDELATGRLTGAALVGAKGHGAEVALRAGQVTRMVSSALMVGPLDTAVRLAAELAMERRLYGAAMTDLPYVRTTIARSYADLLTVDVFSAVGLRALHLRPDTTAGYAAAVHHLSTRVVLDAIDDLRPVLGAQGYLREGRYGMFQKLLRDTAPASFSCVSRAGSLVMLLPRLRRPARRSGPGEEPPADDVFELGGELAPLDFNRLTSGTRGDPLIGVLRESWHDGGPVGRFADRFRGELTTAQDAGRKLGGADLTIDGRPAAFDLAGRYTVLLAAAAALGVWRRAPGRLPRPALLAILDRLTDRLGGPAVLTVTEREHVEYQLFEMVADRVRTNRLLDLSARQLPG